MFVDKDGITVSDDVAYKVDPGPIGLVPGAALGLGLLHRAGFLLVVLSNQSAVAGGPSRETAIADVEAQLRRLLDAIGVPLDGFDCCPHHSEGTVPGYARPFGCTPAPGQLLDAAGRHGIDLEQSWRIADMLDDVEAGNVAGCRTLLLDGGNETEWRLGPGRCPTSLPTA